MIIPTYGEPYRLMDTIGVMTDNSLSWSSGGIDYYLVSDVLNTNELVNIAESINILPTMKCALLDLFSPLIFSHFQ